MSDMNVVFSALAFAAKKHANQRRKNKAAAPYIGHPIQVAQLLTEAGINNSSILAAAILHDTIEDTGTTYEELKVRFSEAVADVVVECTDDKKLPSAERKKRQVSEAPNKSHPATLVKLADKLANLSDIMEDPPADWSDAQRKGYAMWSLAVCQALPSGKGYDTAMRALFSRVLDKVEAIIGTTRVDQAELESYYQEFCK
jgi:GTP diphosphokinase / guanosine-3',5'-bis(diphosphate) 3'-diphosphatase